MRVFHLTKQIAAVYWTGYEYLKANALQRLNQRETNFLISFVCGAMAGSLAAFVTTPFDVVKTHRQITLGKVVTYPFPSFSFICFCQVLTEPVLCFPL